MPANRVVAALAPPVSILAGVITDGLFVHYHIFGASGVSRSAVSSGIENSVIFGVSTLVTYASAHKWLDGWQKWEQLLAQGLVKVAPTLTPMQSDLPAPNVASVDTVTEQTVVAPKGPQRPPPDTLRGS